METSEQAKIPKESRDAKLEQQIFKSIGQSSSIEEKCSLLLKRIVEVEKENKKLVTTIKQHEKRFETICKEKENLQKEYNKGVLIRDKLEQVCREQQKLIKSVKNESMSKIREEEERRKENQAKFQQSINEINLTLGKNNEENIKLREDNIEMTKKLKFLAEQYQAREKQVEKINEQIQLESQLHEAKLAKVQVEATIEKEILLKEKQAALDDLHSCKNAIKELNTRDELLKEQLNLYTSKYDDFQSSLQKSNDIFVTYKRELEKMSKNTKKLEKESFEWKRKWEKSNATLIELATDKQAKDEYVAKCCKQIQQLQKLLRTLQAERTSLHAILKDNNIERPPIPILPSEPETSSLPSPPLPVQRDKMDVMAQNCAELKQTLAKLQGQMNAITAKSTEVESVPSTSSTEKELSKKTKNKKQRNKSKTCPIKDAQIQQQSEMKNSEQLKEDILNDPLRVGDLISAPQTNKTSLATEVIEPLSNSELPIQQHEPSLDNHLEVISFTEDIAEIIENLQDINLKSESSTIISNSENEAPIISEFSLNSENNVAPTESAAFDVKEKRTY